MTFENEIARLKKPWLWHVIAFFNDPRVRSASVREIADAIPRENAATRETVTRVLDQRCRDAANCDNAKEPLFERVEPGVYRMLRSVDPIEEIRIGFEESSRQLLWDEVRKSKSRAWAALSNREQYEEFCRLVASGGPLSERLATYERIIDELSLDDFE